MPARRVFGPSLQTSLSAVVHVYYATSSTHMKQPIKFDKNKYLPLDFRKTQPVNPFEAFMMGLIVVGVATMTATAILGADPTQPFQPVPNQTQTIK